ncbi:MAG TPA: hypothetical protein PKA95_13225 [Thermomicrobiales bacterium]|nr:hypothetical protein [Thermomicrobiales bacterium]
MTGTTGGARRPLDGMSATRPTMSSILLLTAWEDLDWAIADVSVADTAR